MEVANIRQKLHQYVDRGDEKLLKLMYAIAKEYNDEGDLEYEFSEEEIKLFEERRAKRLSGESKTFSWQEAKTYITEMDRRYTELETGKVKGLSFDELATRTRK